ncbi:pilus assembly protein Flp/PilA [Caulobacter rhizosphaerae]|jgi:pilus assembly protein Flp/PilA|uniref:Pilus assembly protein Flp/PilA n=1 Tax=Caulobacter rhizosphaerae TaxID=2010972 RepID=A0ABU1MWJ2_9CAUL|nr:Flp family type IVb pilin [Caulobacter rhizosphaerae]MDR6530549.1 pilus assembly protein Flp/PilA [Caulobacter rhizosphaerae]
MSKFVTAFLNDESGAAAVEYGLIIALIALATVGAFSLLGGDVKSAFQAAADQLAGG